MEFEYCRDYKQKDALRASFHRLAVRTFGLNLEPWYLAGYWGENYIPYSAVQDGSVIANVSVNLMEFTENGAGKHYIQIGTVMTEEAYRGRGLIRRLMEWIFEDYKNADGFYLFANDSVLDFYPKFGFARAEEYQYGKTVQESGRQSAVKVPMETKQDWDRFLNNIRGFHENGKLVSKNRDLLMFHLTSFQKENLYYIREPEAYVIAEKEGGVLLVYDIFSKEETKLDPVIQAFGAGFDRAVFGFTPVETEALECSGFKEEELTLFVKGKSLSGFSDQKMMFPLLTHA